MTLFKTLPLFLPFALMLGCSNPADGVPEAAVSTAAVPPTAAVPVEDARTFAFGPETGSIDFVGSKVTGSHVGGFRAFIGEFTVAGSRLADTGNRVVIDTASVWSDNNRLTGHLKSADFFDVATHSTATFVSTVINQASGETTVTGNLTLHGVTREITFPARIHVDDSEVRVAAEFFINRFDFDIKYPGKTDDLIRKEVVLKINITATPGRADFESVESPEQAATSGR